MDKAYVNFEMNEGVGVVTFYHPQSNSMPGELLKELSSTIFRAGENEKVKVILLKSGGDGAFCAGASFDEMVAIKDLEASRSFFSGFAGVINAMRKVPKFVIARIHGKCVGGGVGIAASADYAIAVEAASIKLSELSIGIGPFVIGPAVERKIGLSAFSQLTINATQWKSAHWAMEKGLFMDVCPTTEEMDEAINRLTKQLSQADSKATHELKKIFWQGTDSWDELLSERTNTVGELALSEFTKNAIEKLKK